MNNQSHQGVGIYSNKCSPFARQQINERPTFSGLWLEEETRQKSRKHTPEYLFAKKRWYASYYICQKRYALKCQKSRKRIYLPKKGGMLRTIFAKNGTLWSKCQKSRKHIYLPKKGGMLHVLYLPKNGTLRSVLVPLPRAARFKESAKQCMQQPTTIQC